MDSLLLKGLRYQAPHGYYEEERIKGNEFEVDLLFKLDLKPAGREDHLPATINYEEAESVARKVMEGEPVKLIETLALRIGEVLFDSYPEVTSLEVGIRKLRPPLETPSEYSEVTMTWQR